MQVPIFPASPVFQETGLDAWGAARANALRLPIRIASECASTTNSGAQMKPLSLLVAAASLLAAAIQPVAAQQRPSAVADTGVAPGSELTEVIVTGTRRVDRTAEESS